MRIKVLIIIMGLFLTVGCNKVDSAKININNNGTHTSKDINTVINKVKSDFKYYEDCNSSCELLNISYDSNKQQIKEWNNTKYYDILVIEFEFIAKENTKTLTKNNTYKYIAYYGKKNKNSSFKKLDWGQG